MSNEFTRSDLLDLRRLVRGCLNFEAGLKAQDDMSDGEINRLNNIITKLEAQLEVVTTREAREMIAERERKLDAGDL